MNNRLLGALAIFFIILSVIFYVSTGAFFYLGLIIVNCCAAICMFGRNRGIVLFFMFLGFLGMIFTAYQGMIYFSQIQIN